MNKMRWLVLAVTILCVSGTGKLFGGWEMISPNPKMYNIEIMGDTWFGIEYHGTTSPGIFLSTRNNGDIWDTVPGFSDIFLIRVHKDRILARGIYNGSLGFYISPDTARTWKKLNWPYPGGVQDMLLSDTAIIMYVSKSSAVESPLYRSLDEGQTWHPLNVETGDVNWTTNINGQSICTFDNTIGAYIVSYGFILSTDGGNTWTKNMNGLPEGYTYGPLSVLPQGFSLRYGEGWYIFNGTSWVKQEYKAYYFDLASEEWLEKTSSIPVPFVCEHRQPYLFAIKGETLESIHYSIDNGKKWFEFTDWGTDFTSAFASSIVISGNYVYAGFATGFARRSLSEAINHVIKPEEIKEKLTAVSPEEMQNILNLFGADALEELLEELGVDSEELLNEDLSDFLDDYIEDNNISDLIGNSQPGTCSYMGMPMWSVNVANLKLFMRDVIFRKQGMGPEVVLAMNYNPAADTSVNLFGKHWSFEYGYKLMQGDSTVTLFTGTGAVFIFSENNKITTGVAPFSLPCRNQKNFKLNWTGSNWQLEKGYGYEFINFVHIEDNKHMLQSIEDAYGKKLSLSLDVEHRPAIITDASGRTYKLTYKNGMCDSVVAPGDRFATFSYNSKKQLQSTTDFNGVSSLYTYDDAGNISSVNIAGKTTAFGYSYDKDTQGTLSRVADPEGRVTQCFTSLIDSVKRLTNITYPGNRNFTYQMNNGWVTSITNAAGDEKQIFYNEAGYPDSLVWNDGSFMTYNYDASNNVIAVRERSGQLRTYEYNENRKLVSEKNEFGDVLYTQTWNSKNQLTSITLADNSVISYTYDPSGALESVIKPGNRTHSFMHDAFGNITSHTNPLGNTMHYYFDTDGILPIGYTDFKGNEYSLEYDLNGRLQQITLPDNSVRSFDYDCCTQTGITDERGNTLVVERDATNRIINTITAEGISSALQYDAGGFISGYSTAYGLEKNLTYDNRGLLMAISDEDGLIRFERDNSGLLAAVINKNGHKTGFAYNESGKLLSITDAAGNSVKMEYDTRQRIASITNARSQSMLLSYDQMRRVTGKTINGITYASYGYNSEGELVTITDSLGTTTYNRNDLGFVTSISYPHGLSVGFQHDANGNVIKTIYPNGTEVINTPDKLNRIVMVNWSDASVDFQYDQAGNLLSEARSNNTITNYEYNNDNLLISVAHMGNDTMFAGENLTLESGIILSSDLKFVPRITRMPEKLLNLGSNNLNQITGSNFNELSFPHDDDGNLTAIEDGNVVRMSATYSHDNMLTSMVAEGSNPVIIRYGAMRYPNKITENGVTALLYYDHKGRLMFETDGTGSLTKIYIYMGKRLIACQTATGVLQYYHYSRLGHTLAITGNDGQILNAYAYSSTGEITGKTETTDNRFTFLGSFGAIRLHDNYVLTGARVYSALTGRYLQRDPLGIVTGTNPYLYASNNPVNGIDPLGLEEQQKTVNAADLGTTSDNEYGTAAGTANPYDEDLPYRGNDWDTYGSAVKQTLEEFSNHPASDFLPSKIADPVSLSKAIDKLANKEYGSALWQFIPFNNSLEAAGNYIMEEAKNFNPANSKGLGIVPFNNQQTFRCDL